MPIVDIILLVLGLWYWAILLLAVALWLNWVSETFAIHGIQNRIKGAGDLRVLTYNINRAHDHSVNKGTTQGIIRFIEKQNADIILLQEYCVELYPDIRKRLELVYPYDLGVKNGNRFKSIFSKFPIEGYEQLRVKADDPKYELFQHNWYSKSRDSKYEVLPVCSMVVKVASHKVRFVNCHLMSNNYSVVIRNSRRNNKNIIWTVLSVMKRVDYGYAVRKLQTEIVCRHLDMCNEKAVIICGDFNDISGSSTFVPFYKRKMQDAWWKGGFGFGFTFHGMKMRLRLDHILYTGKFLQLKRAFVPHSDYSDHNPVVVDFKIV